jgi:hypothetical protein
VGYQQTSGSLKQVKNFSVWLQLQWPHEHSIGLLLRSKRLFNNVIAGTRRINKVRVFGSLAEFAGRLGFRKLSSISLRAPFALDKIANASTVADVFYQSPLKTLFVFMCLDS